MSERPFVERLVAFWSNHLCVSAAAKVLVAPLGRQLRTRGDPSARPRPVRGHGPGVGEASGDARLSRQLPVDRSELARRRTTTRPRGARAQRELRARAARAAHAGRQRRLRAAGRGGAGEDPDWLDGGRTAGWRADDWLRVPGRASRTGCENGARRSLPRRAAWHRANVSSATSAVIRRQLDSSRRNSSRTSSPTLRPPLRSTVSPRSFAASDGDLRAVAAALDRCSRKRGATNRRSSARRRIGSSRRCARSVLERLVR